MKSLLCKLLPTYKNEHKNNSFDIYLGGNLGGRNILIFTEHINATYFISFDIPLRKMHARGEVNVAVVSQKLVGKNSEAYWKQWADTFKPDVVVMTRYSQPYGIKILEYFKSCGIPVIYHIDDDLLELPESLGTEIKKSHGADDIVNTRRYLMNHADMIYASTTHLAYLLQKRFPKQKLIHGIYAPYMGKEIIVKPIDRHNDQVIGYMGSKGHQQDLELVVPALERLLDERPSLHFEVFGTIKMPARLQRFGSRVNSRMVQKSYLEFLRTLSRLGWTLGLAPLVNEPFNQCKAPTKYIEYTACGIPVVASDISVYSEVMPNGGGMLVKDDWYKPTSNFLDSLSSRSGALSLSRQYCEKNFTLSILEDQLRHVFSKASSMSK